MQFAAVNALELWYERRGDGPRLLVIPGSGGDLRNGSSGAPLEARFDVLTYDHRGLGRTSKPAGPYTMAEYADDTAALLDAVGWERCHVLGISFGGMVAQELAIRHPDRIDRLVLACSSAGGAGGASAPLHEFAQLPLDERVNVQLEVLDRRHDHVWRALHPDEVAAFRARLERAAERDEETLRGARLQLAARAGHNTYERLAAIAAPTLIAAGRYDGQAPPENQRALLGRIPGARLEYFEGGHGFIREDPAAYPRVAEFVLTGR
ncbi:MAG: alpha/beta fold hydrolase [Chloroflexi bacterium]|nr:alpha/beta fold hydrolase [Chloroflexota bacterium]